MKVTLIRHTTLNVPSHICYGQSDVDVSDSFHRELQALQKKLGHFEFDAIYTSPLRRCHKLAQALCECESLGISADDIQLDDRLRELSFGDWEMSPWDAIPREPFDRWAEDYTNLAPPNGETFTQLHARAKSFVEEVSGHSHGKNLLVVTHGGLIRALIAETLNLPLKRLFRIAIDHGSVTQLEFTGEIPKVLCINA